MIFNINNIMLPLKRTDSTTIISYNNKVVLIQSPYQLQKKVSQIDNDLKKKFYKYKNE